MVLDLGTGTGAIALALAPDAKRVVGRDISEGMLEQARDQAAGSGVENVDFGDGRFRAPNVDRPVDTSHELWDTPSWRRRDARLSTQSPTWGRGALSSGT